MKQSVRLRVRDIMQRNVISVGPDTSLDHRLLVVDGAKLVGLVTSLDLVGLLLDDGDTRDSSARSDPRELGEIR